MIPDMEFIFTKLFATNELEISVILNNPFFWLTYGLIDDPELLIIIYDEFTK